MQSIAAGIPAGICAQEIIKAVARGKYEALIGGIEKYSVLIKRFFPGLLRMGITKHPVRKLRSAGLLPNENRVKFNP
jgi:hypothetical protein